MTAPTASVEWLLARAGVNARGLLHVVSERDSGLLNPVCGAHPIRSAQIERRHQLDDLTLLCPGCGTMAASIGGTVVDGVALLLGLSTTVATARLLEVAPAALHTGPGARTADDDLIASIRNSGVVTPVLARRTRDGLVVVDGARRVHAAVAAGAVTVPVVVRDLDDEQTVIEQLLANLHRVDLDPIAQANAFQDAVDRLGLSKQALADGLGVSRSQVSNTIRLLALPAPLRDHVAAGRLTAEQGRDLLRYDGAEQVERAEALLEQRATRAASPRSVADPQLAAVAALLAGVLDAKATIRPLGDDKRRITLDVSTSDLPRVLAQLGLAS